MTAVPLKRRAALVTACADAGELPLITLDLIESGGGRLTRDNLPLAEMPAVGAALVQPGDVLYGKLRPYLAKSLLVSASAYASTELLALRPTKHLDSRFLAYLVQARPFIEWTVATSEGTKMPRTSWEKAGSFGIDDLPLGRQRSIADFLDTETARIDALITKKRQLIDLNEERRWVSFLTRVRSSDGPHVPLRRALRFITDGPFGSAFTSNEYTTQGLGVIRLGNIGFADFRHAEMAYLPSERLPEFHRYRVRAGDLLFAGLGDDRNHAGRACVAPDLGHAIVKGKCFCARVDLARAVPDYVAMFFSSPAGAEQVALQARGSTRSMINLDIIKSVTLPMPHVSIQQSVVERTRREWQVVKRLRDDLEAQIDLLQEHRQALITSVVAGHVEVPGAST